MRLVYADHEMDVDFVFATPDTAREAIESGVANGIELLEQAGLTAEEAEAKLARLRAN
jgi:hypothetical protein